VCSTQCNQNFDTEGDGLYHFGQRYYDQSSHWTQQDRLSGDITQPGSVNRYLYTGENPVNYVDTLAAIHDW